MKTPLFPFLSPRVRAAFTVIELLVATVVFLVLGVIVVQLLSSATQLTGMSSRKQEADVQARLVFGRMGLDFVSMLKRADVKYFLQTEPGNDRLAFLSEVAGYYPSAAAPGSVSVVAYRLVDTGGEFRGLERLSQGLSWQEDATGESPVVFHRDPGDLVPAAVATEANEAYEVVGPGVIRFEYFYVLKNGTLSANPWDAAAGHTEEAGLRDVAAICVVLAVVDPSGFVRITPAEIRGLAGKLPDFNPGSMPTLGDLEKQWQRVLDADEAVQKLGGGARVHSRCFPITS